jgi:hypothetical protein
VLQNHITNLSDETRSGRNYHRIARVITHKRGLFLGDTVGKWKFHLFSDPQQLGLCWKGTYSGCIGGHREKRGSATKRIWSSPALTDVDHCSFKSPPSQLHPLFGCNSIKELSI